MTYPRKVALELRSRFEGACIETITTNLCIDYYEFCLSPSIRGFKGVTGGAPYIVVNRLLPIPWKNAVAFHELGHILLHDTPGHFFLKKHTLLATGKLERQANEFAAEYLIPDAVFTSKMDKRVLAEELQVPVQLFKHKKPPANILSNCV